MKQALHKHKAIITGACGTIGRGLSQRLMEMGVSVIGIGREDHSGVFNSLIKQYPSSMFMKGDLLDTAFLMRVFKEVQDDQMSISIFHLASQSDVMQCEADPISAFQQNTMATANVLEACVKNRITRFIFSSTSYVYGDNYQEDIREEFDLHPAGIYPLSKAASEVITKGYAEHHKLHCCIVRIANVYGPQLKPGTVLETMTAQLKQGSEIVLRDFTPVRDFIYIEDVIEALSRLMMYGEQGCRVLNLSTGHGISMGELAQLLCDIKRSGQKIVLKPNQSGLHVSRLVLDNQALSRYLHWQPTITVRDGLKKILEIHDGININVKT